MEVYATAGTVDLYLNGTLVGSAETKECYALFEVGYQPGCLCTKTSSGETCKLCTADAESAHPVVEDVRRGGLIFSQIHLEDKAGTRVLGSGQTYDATRKGFELLAAGSEKTAPAETRASTVAIHGLGALAIYR